MKALVLSLFAVAVVGQAAAQSQPVDPLNLYVRAHASGNGAFLREAFSADARVIGYRDGKLVSISLDEYAAKFSGRPAADESKRRRTVEVLEQTADAAVGKVVLDYPAIRFTDYMALLKIDGQWRIVNKSFHAEVKAPAQ